MSRRADSTAAEREHALKLLRSKSDESRALAAELLCQMFEPLITTQARAYRQHVPGSELEDLEQEARVGLLEAIRTFNPKKGAFPTHATWQIRNALSKCVEGLGNPVALPGWMIRRVPKMKRIIAVLTIKFERSPSSAEVAAEMPYRGKLMNASAIETMMAYAQGPEPLPPWVTGEEFSNSRVHGDTNVFFTRMRNKA